MLEVMLRMLAAIMRKEIIRIIERSVSPSWTKMLHPGLWKGVAP